ncbi:MAG: septum formation initiator family protein [Candidatus Omnitrophica bacterium]|jgi:cell division protein FtsB|nr:septum formation initiator family protein [Candidatus Omnitrophota bacterium]
MFKNAFWLFGLAVLLFVIFLPGYSRMQDLRQRNRDLHSKIRRLQIENTILEKDARKAQDDPFYKEKVARERMGIVRKGEVPVKVVPQEQ